MIAKHQAHCTKNTEAYLKEAEKAGYDDLEEYEADIAAGAMLWLVLAILVSFVLGSLFFILYITQ